MKVRIIASTLYAQNKERPRFGTERTFGYRHALFRNRDVVPHTHFGGYREPVELTEKVRDENADAGV